MEFSGMSYGYQNRQEEKEEFRQISCPYGYFAVLLYDERDGWALNPDDDFELHPVVGFEIEVNPETGKTIGGAPLMLEHCSVYKRGTLSANPESLTIESTEHNKQIVGFVQPHQTFEEWLELVRDESPDERNEMLNAWVEKAKQAGKL